MSPTTRSQEDTVPDEDHQGPEEASSRRRRTKLRTVLKGNCPYNVAPAPSIISLMCQRPAPYGSKATGGAKNRLLRPLLIRRQGWQHGRSTYSHTPFASKSSVQEGQRD